MAASSDDQYFAQAKAGLRPSKSTSDKDDQLISFVEDGLNRNGKPARSKPALGLNRKKAEKKKKNSRKKQDLLSRFMIPLQSSAPEVAGLLRLCCAYSTQHTCRTIFALHSQLIGIVDTTQTHFFV